MAGDPPWNNGYAYASYDESLSDGEYLAFSREWMTAVRRVLKPAGSNWVFANHVLREGIKGLLNVGRAGHFVASLRSTHALPE